MLEPVILRTEFKDLNDFAQFIFKHQTSGYSYVINQEGYLIACNTVSDRCTTIPISEFKFPYLGETIVINEISLKITEGVLQGWKQQIKFDII